MSYDEPYIAGVAYWLSPQQMTAIRMTDVANWKPIGKSANEIVAKLDEYLDNNWLGEYLSYCDPSDNCFGYI